MAERLKPGAVRDAILAVLSKSKEPMTVGDIHAAAEKHLGSAVAQSSVRSYLNLNTPGTFLRTGRGTYRLVRQ